MARLLTIDDCSDCIHFSADVTCDLSGGRTVDDDCGIPDWCPLPEAEEVSDDDATE